MKYLLSFAGLLLAASLHAANPAFQDFYGTNGIIIRTNGNKVQVDGFLLSTNGIINANIWTNDNGRVRPLLDASFRIALTNTDLNTPILIMGGTGASNWMATAYGGSLLDYSIFSGHISAEGDLNNHNIAVASAQDSGGQRYGYAAFEVKTNQAGVFLETLITGQGTQRFLAGHFDSGGNQITLVTNTVEAFKVDGVGGISLMKAVPQNWPDAQGGASTALTNDGAGNLGWSAFSSGGSSLLLSNTTWVAKNGNDTTALISRPDLPFLTISNAVQASPDGFTVLVMPGVYNESVNLKNMVDLHMPSGVIVSQSVLNLPVLRDAGNTVTSRLSGDFTLVHANTSGTFSMGVYTSGTDSDISLNRVTIYIASDAGYGIQTESGNSRTVGDIYSNGTGLASERGSGTGFVSFVGSIFATNNAAFLNGGSGGSNYLRGYFSSTAYHAFQLLLGSTLVEDSEVISYDAHRTFDISGGNTEIRNTKVTALVDEAIGRYGSSGFLILDDVQLIAGSSATYSIDNTGDPLIGTVELRTPIWANKPIRPDMNIVSNGFTRLSRYLSITTNDYEFPALQAAGFLQNNGSGSLLWSTNVGTLYVTNLVVDGTTFRTNQYTTNISLTPVEGSFWFGNTNGAPLTNGPRVANWEWIPVMRSMRQGDVGSQGPGHDTIDTQSVSNYWNATNRGFGSIAFGSNNWAWGNYSLIGNGMFNIIGSNAVGSSILGGSNNVIHTNSAMAFIGGGTINKIRMNSPHAVIVGGMDNNIHDGDWSFIGGGQGHDIGATGISVQNSVIAGGSVNTLFSSQGFIGGGANNDISTTADYSTISGGNNNNIAAGANTSTIGGGGANNIFASSTSSTIAGGNGNTIGTVAGTAATLSTIGGGSLNIIAQGSDFSTIAGGQLNLIGGVPNSDFGTILGGASNNIPTSVNMVTVIGNFITNSVSNAIEIGHGASGGNNRKMRITTNGAVVMTYGGPSAVGGTYLVTNTPIASAGAAATNLQVVTIGAHVLTNNQERLTFRASGRFDATTDTRLIEVIYGSETIYSSTAQAANSGSWTLDGEIIRTGNTSQSCNVTFGGNTNTLFVAAQAQDTAQTNGIATVLKIMGTTAGNGGITNRTLTVMWWPNP